MHKALIYLFIIISFVAKGQEDYRFTNYTINEGLSQSSVSCIIQDELFTLWVGTQDGLNRYNGREFKVFNSDNTTGIKNDYFTCALEDKSGNIWFGTTNGLTRFDINEERFTSYAPSEKQVFNIKKLVTDKEGNLWIATTETGIFRFDTRRNKFSSFGDKLNAQQISDIIFINDFNLAVASLDKGFGLFNIKDGSWKVINNELSSRSLTINKLVNDTNQRIIIGTNRGVYSLNLITGKINDRFGELTEKNKSINITDIAHETTGAWFFTTLNDGLYTLTNSGELLHSKADFFQKNVLLFDELNVIYGDANGIFWVGSQRGLSAFDPKYNGILGIGASGNFARGLPSSSVWSFDESKDGQYLYIGSDIGFSRMHKKTGVFEQFLRVSTVKDESGGEKTTLDLELIDDNYVLVGSADGFYEVRIVNGKSNFKKIPLSNNPKISHRRVYKIVHWKNKQYFIATSDGVILYDLSSGVKGRFIHNEEDKSILKGICRVAFKDSKNQIWFATSSGGLNHYLEDEGVIQPYKFNDKILAASTDLITTIYSDNEDVFWLGTAGSGLLRLTLSTGKVEKFTKKDGLPNNVIYGILGDEKGNLWMSTNKGLCSFNITNKEIRVYTELDGLMGKEFNLGAFMKSKNGNLFFGGIYGCNYFNPNELQQSKKNIQVILSGLKIENKLITPTTSEVILSAPIFRTSTINLSYKQRSFTISFHATSLSEGEQIFYKYILEGSDDGEVQLGLTNEIHFSSLSPGEYTLKIYAKKGDGAWSTSPATLKIIIASPYWMKWWFWIVSGILLFLIVRFVIRQRISLARREQVRLEMKIRKRTKEIEEQKVKIQIQNEILEQERNKVLKQQELLKIEKEKSEKLLKNIIPESTAEELKKSGKARARAYKTVSVLFTDFVGFTKISDRLSPTELVRKLDVYFTKFDEIIVKNNLEKIKTIGDAYMCAGGVPVRNNTNPIDTCLAALQIQHYMDQRKNEALANGDEYWSLRLGINTGEVTAGVIGSERLAYDIWGATVNQAQRMEMLGEPGKVTITGETYQHIEPYFECVFKGKAQSKSRGIIDMYVIEGIKSELSLNGAGIFPNKRFHQIVNLHHYSSINYYKAERHIMRLLESQLSKDLYYHSIDHTKDVVQAVEHIALLENVTDEGLFLLKSAATYHDAGFIEQYDSNEPIGARLAEEILPKYGYSDQHIEKIKELIYVTMIPHQPKNQLEEIMCDADLDYLGRDDFHEISDKLRRELREHDKINSDRQWDEIQVKFFKLHKYFTKTAIKTREKKKESNLKEVLDRLERNEYKD